MLMNICALIYYYIEYWYICTAASPIYRARTAAARRVQYGSSVAYRRGRAAVSWLAQVFLLACRVVSRTASRLEYTRQQQHLGNTSWSTRLKALVSLSSLHCLLLCRDTSTRILQAQAVASVLEGATEEAF
eukprot:6176366-Pleurochrysis_carterae.AAC.4